VQLEPEITVKGMKLTPRLNEMISRGIGRLEQVCDHIISAHIALEQEQGRHQTGNPYRMRIAVRMAGRPEIVVERHSKAFKRGPGGDSATQIEETPEGDAEEVTPRTPRRVAEPRSSFREEPIVTLIRRSFDSAQRELEKAVDKQRYEVKTSATASRNGLVERLDREHGYGFLRSATGEDVYFHKNSVLHGRWEDLTLGSGVSYSSELGEKGLQATSVELIQKLGASEKDGVLQDLPEAVISAKPKKSARSKAKSK
jgi:cold shock CspA family protein/ribosome-associated translation inhibitor RaiA